MFRGDSIGSDYVVIISSDLCCPNFDCAIKLFSFSLSIVRTTLSSMPEGSGWTRIKPKGVTSARGRLYQTVGGYKLIR